jgi:hypothetical protein
LILAPGDGAATASVAQASRLSEESVLGLATWCAVLKGFAVIAADPNCLCGMDLLIRDRCGCVIPLPARIMRSEQ